MAERDDTARTEQPTAKRLEEARKRGQVAVSQDLKLWALLVASALFVLYWLPAAARDLLRLLLPFIAQPEAITLDQSVATAGLAGLTKSVALVMAPMLAGLVGAAIFAGVGQVGLLWSPSRIKPDFNKISPLKGISRLFSAQALVEFLKGLLKVAATAAVAIAIAIPVIRGIEPSLMDPLTATLSLLAGVSGKMVAGAAALMTILAAADLFYQRHAHMRQLRMTRQEVRDELKQSDGDPFIKSKLKRLRMERARKRMMAAVPEATVVITNPTHFAVALRYDMAAMPAPKVVAKGVDHLALRIRALAIENDVPVVENPPLARALHAAVEVDDEIPPEHYQAVAQVIGHVMRLNGQEQRGRQG